MSDEEFITAYRDTGSIWKAGKRVGLAGQSVHERLQRLGMTMAHQMWSRAETEEARSLATQGEPMAQIAARLGRTYHAVALKLSRLGVRSQNTSWRWRPRRAPRLTKAQVEDFARELGRGGISVRRLARREGVAITPLIAALQFHEPRAWHRYVEGISNLAAQGCVGCARRFRPLTRRQVFCTVRCREAHRRDVAYFGGRRHETIGLREKVCQLCRAKVEKWLSAHHILGKANDPENQALLALCIGCHHIVTRLASQAWVEDADVFVDLVALALARRGRTKAFVFLEFEDWTIQDIQDAAESLGAQCGT